MAHSTSNHSGSTEYAKQRYAHPFYLPVPSSDRQPIDGATHMTEWSKKQLGPIPSVKGKSSLTLEDVIGTEGTTEIEQAGALRFHALGDSGVGNAQEAEDIAGEMATDYKVSAGGLNPAFLFHLGDVIYGPDKDAHYVERFYRPYRHYPGKIIAIPGNHDGEAKTAADEPSLKSFLANFCAQTAEVPASAKDSGIYRETMTQPGVYWMLDAPFVRIVGLYSNRLENPGYLQGITKGKSDSSQIQWLQNTLKGIAGNKQNKALVIATHHPPYSQSGHSGSTEMNQTIDQALAAAGIVPDLFLSAHSHTYQRYTRHFGGKPVPYIVVGTGGMPPQPVTAATGQPVAGVNDVTYDSAASSLGYLYVTIGPKQLKTEFWQLGKEHTKAFDTVIVDLKERTII
jgi:Calcineurin-like phosphoesterase